MKISQREARRLRKRVAELQEAEDLRRRRWSQTWVGGIEITSCQHDASGIVPVALRTANRLSHAVVAVADDAGRVRFIALPHPKVGA